MNIKKGEELILRIESLAFEGKAIARVGGLVVFVNDAVPGDTVRAAVTKVKAQFLEAKNLETLEFSPVRTDPRCRYSGSCGGCKMQHIDYPAQLKYKRQHVADAFERIGKFSGLDIPEPVGAGEIFFYRNKMEYSFSDQRWLTQAEIESGEDYRRDFALGLHVPGRFDKVIDIEECWLQSPESNRIAASLRKSALEMNIRPYGTKTHEGLLRFVVIRQSRSTGGIMVNIVTSDHRQDILQPVVNRLLEDVPEITTVINNINRKKAQVAVGDEEIIYHGDGYITEKVDKYIFRISPNSFFQTNTAQAERLYSIAREFGGLTGHYTVIDLYSGTGSIAIYLAEGVGKVYGIETVADSVRDAEVNASLNGITNVTFIQGDVLERLAARKEWMNEEPTVVYLDPPRSGIHPKAVREIGMLRVPKLVYISCNPVTQARDIAALAEYGYRIERLRPVDMFPHTYHIENVALLNLATG